MLILSTIHGGKQCYNMEWIGHDFIKLLHVHATSRGTCIENVCSATTDGFIIFQNNEKFEFNRLLLLIKFDATIYIVSFFFFFGKSTRAIRNRVQDQVSNISFLENIFHKIAYRTWTWTKVQKLSVSLFIFSFYLTKSNHYIAAFRSFLSLKAITWYSCMILCSVDGV